MSTDVTLVALAKLYQVPSSYGEIIPYVVDEFHAGCLTLAHTLKSEIAPRGLLSPEEFLGLPPTPGLLRYLVIEPKALAVDIELARVEESLWEGLNNPEELIEELRAHPEYIWWFHVDF